MHQWVRKQSKTVLRAFTWMNRPGRGVRVVIRLFYLALMKRARLRLCCDSLALALPQAISYLRDVLPPGMRRVEEGAHCMRSACITASTQRWRLKAALARALQCSNLTARGCRSQSWCRFRQGSNSGREHKRALASGRLPPTARN